MSQSRKPHDSHHGIPWVIMFLCMAFINVPNVLPWGSDGHTTSLDLLVRFATASTLILIFFNLFSKEWVGWLVLWIFVLWWMPLAIAVREVNNSSINANLLGTLFASSPEEILGMLESISFKWILLVFCINALNAAILIWMKKKFDIHFSMKLRLNMIFMGLLLFVALFIHMNGNQIADVKNLNKELEMTFPFELPLAMVKYHNEKKVIDAARARMRKNGIYSNQISLNERSPEIFVLVIGESSSRGAWHIFNKNKMNTTPRLEARMHAGQGVYSFTDVIAQSTATRQSVPSMLSSQPLIWPDGLSNPNATPSIMSEAKNAGYSNAWFSNQAAIGEYDGVVAAYVEEADAKAFLNTADFTQQGAYDAVLIQPLERFIQKNEKSFVVLHTLGSHFNFSQRYPAEFKKFQNEVGQDGDYRNSILYTDYILDRVIDSVARQNKSAVVLYISDHGQGLEDPMCGMKDINRFTMDSYEIPALIWLSNAYREKNPVMGEKLKANKDSPYMASAVHGTVRDLIIGDEIFSSDYSAQGEKIQSFARVPDINFPRKIVAPDQKWIDMNKIKQNRCIVGLR